MLERTDINQNNCSKIQLLTSNIQIAMLQYVRYGEHLALNVKVFTRFVEMYLCAVYDL